MSVVSPGNGTGICLPLIQLFTDDGVPAAGYKLFVYTAGTTNTASTYSNYLMTVANTSPVVLDSAGRAVVYLAAGIYKFVLAPPDDTDPPTSPVWTQDYVESVPNSSTNVDVLGFAGETIAKGNVVYCSDGSGSLTAGYWYKASTANDYSSVNARAIGIALQDMAAWQYLIPPSDPTGRIRIAGRVTGYNLATLVPGTSYYISNTAGALTTTAGTSTTGAARRVCIADSASSFVIANWEWSQYATGSVPGLVSINDQTFAGIKLFNNGAKALQGTIQAPFSRVLFADATAYKQATPAVGGETGWSVSIPAGTLTKNGDVIRVTIGCSEVGAANTQTEMRLAFGATPVTIAWRFSDNATKTSGTFTVLIQRYAATTIKMVASGITLVPASCTAINAGTETCANALTLHTQHGTGASGTEYMQQEDALVEYIPAP